MKDVWQTPSWRLSIQKFIGKALAKGKEQQGQPAPNEQANPIPYEKGHQTKRGRHVRFQ